MESAGLIGTEDSTRYNMYMLIGMENSTFGANKLVAAIKALEE